jgi:hypothetical protein
MSPISRGFVTALERFAARRGIPLVQFHKGERKDTVMAEHLRRFARDEGVMLLGKAQEKTPVFRTEKRKSPTTGKPYPGSCAPVVSRRWWKLAWRGSGMA